MKIIVPVDTAVVLALALMPASAAFRHHKRHSEAAPVAQPQIACTVVGCIPVRRGCHPAIGYTPDGTPTGFDVEVCPTTRFTDSAANRTRVAADVRFWPKADIGSLHRTCPLLGVKQTWRFADVRFRGRYWGKADMPFCTAHVRL